MTCFLEGVCHWGGSREHGYINLNEIQYRDILRSRGNLKNKGRKQEDQESNIKNNQI